jgi:hypothetical protein
MVRSSVFRTAAVMVLAGSSLAFAGQASSSAPKPAAQKPQATTSEPSVSKDPTDAFGNPIHAAARGGLLVNVRLDLTITDQKGSGAPATKTVSMLVADQNNFRVRSVGEARIGGSFRPVTLNVDGQPSVLRDGRIKVSVNLEYRAPGGEGTDESQPQVVTESFHVILNDEKPMLVSQSADPASDRKVRVELKATIVK